MEGEERFITAGGKSTGKGLKATESARISKTISWGLGKVRWLLLHSAYSKVPKMSTFGYIKYSVLQF